MANPHRLSYSWGPKTVTKCGSESGTATSNLFILTCQTGPVLAKIILWLTSQPGKLEPNSLLSPHLTFWYTRNGIEYTSETLSWITSGVIQDDCSGLNALGLKCHISTARTLLLPPLLDDFFFFSCRNIHWDVNKTTTSNDLGSR